MEKVSEIYFGKKYFDLKMEMLIIKYNIVTLKSTYCLTYITNSSRTKEATMRAVSTPNTTKKNYTQFKKTIFRI